MSAVAAVVAGVGNGGVTDPKLSGLQALLRWRDLVLVVVVVVVAAAVVVKESTSKNETDNSSCDSS